MLRPCLGRSPPLRRDVLLALGLRTSIDLKRSGEDSLRRGEFERLTKVLLSEAFGVIFFELACLLRSLDRTLLEVLLFEMCRLGIFSAESFRSERR